jgi:hypothetical protein
MRTQRDDPLFVRKPTRRFKNFAVGRAAAVQAIWRASLLVSRYRTSPTSFGATDRHRRPETSRSCRDSCGSQRSRVLTIPSNLPSVPSGKEKLGRGRGAPASDRRCRRSYNDAGAADSRALSVNSRNQRPPLPACSVCPDQPNTPHMPVSSAQALGFSTSRENPRQNCRSRRARTVLGVQPGPEAFIQAGF